MENLKKWDDSIHSDLLATKNLVYDPGKFICSIPIPEKESSDYGAYKFQLNGLSMIFRVAKVTPKKVGQFVTFWKRIGSGPIQPYDVTDTFDFLVVSTRKGGRFGQFVFPKATLLEQKILSKNGQGGKRAMRVYPSWDKAESLQAKKTQSWQLRYFFEISQSVRSLTERLSF